MNRYKLLKDTPTLKAGTIFKGHISDFDSTKELVRITPENSETAPMWTIDDIDNFDEWFEEIPEEYKRWRADEGEDYFYYSFFENKASRATDFIDVYDSFLYVIGNYFKTRSEAEKYGEYLRALQVIKDDAKGFEPDWNDYSQPKLYGFYNYGDRRLSNGTVCSFKSQGTIYFKSKEDIEESFKKHRKEWLTVLGVEE